MTLHAAALLLGLLAASSLLTSASEDERLTRLKPNYFPSLASSPDNIFWYYTFDEMDDFFDQSEHWGGMEFNEGLSWEAWLPEKRCLDGTYSHRRVGQTFAERTWINNASLRQEEPCEEGIFPFPWILHDDEGAKWSYALVSEGEDTFNTYMHMISVRYTEEMLHIFDSDPVFRLVGFMVNTTDIWWEPRRHRSRDCNGTEDIVWSRDGVAEVSKVWVGTVPISETKVCPEDNHGSWEQRTKEEKVQSTGWFPLFEPSLPDPKAHPEEAGYGFVGFMPIVDIANTTTEEPAPTTERGISTTERPVQPAPSKTLPHPTVESHHPSLTHAQGSHLRPSHAQGSHLRPSHAQGSNLRPTHAQGSHLRPAHAQGSHLRPAHAQGSFFYPARIQGNRDSPWWWSNLFNYGRGSYIEIVECPRVGSACSFRKWGTRISNCCSAAACDTLYCPYYSFTWICADRRRICRKL